MEIFFAAVGISLLYEGCKILFNILWTESNKEDINDYERGFIDGLKEYGNRKKST